MRTLAILSVLLIAACASSHAPLTGEGVAATEVTDDSVIIWSRGTTRGSMQVTVTDADGFTATGVTPLAAASDFTGQVTIDNLHPAGLKIATGESEQCIFLISRIVGMEVMTISVDDIENLLAIFASFDKHNAPS